MSAAVELLAYIVVHLILDRVGRKFPYCLFAILFGIVAILVLPVQKFTTKDGQGLFERFSQSKFLFDLFSVQTILMNLINGSLKFLASASYAIIYIYANELFPTNIRNTGMGICSMVARIGAIIGTFCNDSLVSLSVNMFYLVQMNDFTFVLIDSYLDLFTHTSVWYCFIDSCSFSFTIS